MGKHLLQILRCTNHFAMSNFKTNGSFRQLAVGIVALTLLSGFFFSLSSCGKNYTYKRKKRNIIGDWKIVAASHEEYRADTLYFEENEPVESFEISFFEDGTGERRGSGFVYEFEWFYQYDPEAILVVGEYLPDISLHINTFLYHVLENERDHQLWMYEVVPNQDTLYLITWELERK